MILPDLVAAFLRIEAAEAKTEKSLPAPVRPWAGPMEGRALILLPADWLPAAGASDDWSPARGTPGPARGAPAVHKEAAMAAEASTACLSLSAYVERKSRTWGAAEGCTRCARKMTGEEREG